MLLVRCMIKLIGIIVTSVASDDDTNGVVKERSD